MYLVILLKVFLSIVLSLSVILSIVCLMSVLFLFHFLLTLLLLRGGGFAGIMLIKILFTRWPHPSFIRVILGTSFLV